MVRSRSGDEPGEPTRLEGQRATSRSLSGPSGHSRSQPAVAATKGAAALLADDDDSINMEDAAFSSPNQAPSEPLPENERAFGRYSLLRRLAYGGMGEIFLARQGGVGSLAPVAKLVVIKRILSHMKRDEKHRKMFLDEARLQALLANPHIVAIHDMGEENGHVYLAMEHVHGPSWRALVDRCRKLREPIPLAHVASLVAQAARGLSYAHNLVDVTGAPLRIVHRDINPHNLLVNYEGEVKLIDFGIAKSELADGQTETGTIKGKFSYMSPEQSAALPLDHRSDVFALGICLYELLTLENPFRKTNVVLSLESIQRDTPPPLERRRRDSGPFQTIVDRCLAKEREDRFDDCGDIARVLDGLIVHGVIAPADKPLSTWLREIFADEIAAHVQILEQTGSQGALALRAGSDPSGRRLTHTKPPGERSSSGARSPVAALLEEARGETLVMGAPDMHTTATPAPRLSPPVDDFDVLSIADHVEPQARARWPLFALAGIAAAVGAGVLVQAGVVDRILEGRMPFDTDPIAIVVPPDPTPDVPTPVPTPVDPPPERPDVPAPIGDPPEVPPSTPPDAPPEREPPPREPDVPPEEPAPIGDPPKAERRRPKRDPAPPPEAAVAKKEIVGTLLVTSEGYQVKGSRKVVVGESTTLVVDDADAPYALKLRARADGDGLVSFDVESEPWSIVRIDGVGKGRSPQRNLVLPVGKRVDIELTNPKAGPMRLTLMLK